jgi:hypothetical protein
VNRCSWHNGGFETPDACQSPELLSWPPPGAINLAGVAPAMN